MVNFWKTSGYKRGKRIISFKLRTYVSNPPTCSKVTSRSIFIGSTSAKLDPIFMRSFTTPVTKSSGEKFIGKHLKKFESEETLQGCNTENLENHLFLAFDMLLFFRRSKRSSSLLLLLLVVLSFWAFCRRFLWVRWAGLHATIRDSWRVERDLGGVLLREFWLTISRLTLKTVTQINTKW